MSGEVSALLAAGHADNNVSRSIVNQSVRSSFFAQESFTLADQNAGKFSLDRHIAP